MPVVEDQLALTSDDLKSLLLSFSLRSDDLFLKEFNRAVGGWPVAAQFFLRSAECVTDMTQIASMTREGVFDYLSDQVVSVLPSERLSFLKDLAFSSVSDPDILMAFGRPYPQAELAWLRTAPVPLVRTPGGVRLHDLFAEFVRRTTLPEERREIVERLFSGFVKLRRIGEAADLARAYAPERLPAFISEYGFALLDEGRWETAAQIVQVVPRSCGRRMLE